MSNHRIKAAFFDQYAVLGGCTAQLFNRLVLKDMSIEPHFVFLEEHGGSRMFGDYPHILSQPSESTLAQYLSKHQFDVVSLLDTPSVLKTLCQIRFTGKTICEVHTTYEQNLKYLQNDNVMKNVDVFLTPSEYMKILVSNQCCASKGKPIDVMPDCIDVSRFKLRTLHHETTRPIVLWIGRLDDHKNWRGFLEAAELIRERVPSVLFWIVGGNTASEDIVEGLFESLHRHDLLSSMHWIQKVSYSRMPIVYNTVAQSGGCMLVTAHGESFSMTSLEALCSGCPVVAPNHTALPEILDNGSRGLLYDPGSTKDAARSTLKMLQDDALREQMIATAIHEVPARHDSLKIARRYEKLLRSLSANTV